MGSRYDFPAGATLRITNVSGHVTVLAEDRPDLEVEPPKHRPETEEGGRTVYLRAVSSHLQVRCPAGADVVVGSVSGHIKLEGHFGSVRASTMSGHIEVGRASGDVDARSVSGHLTVEACGGRCQLNTKSGRISVGRVEKAVRASTLSGHVDVGTAGQDDVEIKTVSGGVRVEVEGGRKPRARLRSLSGRVRCECPEGADFDIKASTLSGSIEVTGQ
jgi:DUF4097 and DUF4098 domain-containing protein YvlB